MSRPVALERAYLAGFFDGEGTICFQASLNNGPRKYYPHVSVSNTDRMVLERFQNLFGGRITIQPSGPNCRVCWRWRIPVGEVWTFLRSLRPYLQIKRRQVDLVLAWLALSLPERRAQGQALKATLSHLNGRGAAAAALPAPETPIMPPYDPTIWRCPA